MFNYDYLEADVQIESHLRLDHTQDRSYAVPPDVRFWISQELEKRRQQLSEREEEEVGIYLTKRQFRKNPVFALAVSQAGGKHVLEAWYFHYVPAVDDPSSTLQLVLDRVALQQLFPEQNIPKA